MADISKSGVPSLSTLEPRSGVCKLPALPAGEALVAGDACYIASDGTIMLSNATDGHADANVHGYAPISCESGAVITLVHNVCFRYGASLTPGIPVFLSAAVDGAIADTASAGAPGPLGFVVDATRVYLHQSKVAVVDVVP
jgi:hypothetical protein